MRTTLTAALAAAAVAVTLSFASTASAADLGGYHGGSVKDGYVPVAPVSAGPCYIRGDVGYSWSSAPKAEYVGNVDPSIFNESLGNSWLFEGGVGCGSGSKGLRGEVVWGSRTERDFKGHYTDFTPPVPVDPTLTTKIQTYTMMFNGYYDLGRYHGFVPYVGAGIGWAYHKMNNVHSDFNGGCGGCAQLGEDKLSLAWSLMAGVGYQISERAILDVGYRYIDMGWARSSNADTNFGWNPRLEVNDMRAHEIKVGLRYHFGTGSDCCAYAPMK